MQGTVERWIPLFFFFGALAFFWSFKVKVGCVYDFWFCKKRYNQFFAAPKTRNDGLKYLSIYAKYVIITVLIFMKQINRLNGLNNLTIKPFFSWKLDTKSVLPKITCQVAVLFSIGRAIRCCPFSEAKVCGAPWKVGRRTATRTCRVGGRTKHEFFLWKELFFLECCVCFVFCMFFFGWIQGFFRFNLPKTHP